MKKAVTRGLSSDLANGMLLTTMELGNGSKILQELPSFLEEFSREITIYENSEGQLVFSVLTLTPLLHMHFFSE